MVKAALIDSLRSAALRRPQSGTPRQAILESGPGDELVGDESLLAIGLHSAGAAVLCGVLLRAQIQTYKRTRHVISLSDEYSMRRIRNAARTGRMPNIYARCLRCGCVALLIDWCAAGDLAQNDLMVSRRWPEGHRHPVSREFYSRCTGNEKAREALFLLE